MATQTLIPPLAAVMLAAGTLTTQAQTIEGPAA
jgi:hypothetical protein